MGVKKGRRIPLLVAAAACSTAISGPVSVDDKWRFQAVTDRLIRIEYDGEKAFVDVPTIAFLRSELKGSFAAPSKSGDWTILNTSKVSVQYKSASSPTNGSVIVSSRTDGAHVWKWGDDPEPGNLRGTARTLDSGAETLDLNCHNKVSPTMKNTQEHCTWGLISRKGWAVVDDTGAPQWRDDWYAPSRNSTDVSVFMHGLDYAGALKDFFHAAGPANVPPRYALGTIFTRWFDFDQESAIALAKDFESRSVPLDTWIFDMNWHQYGPWGSFTWNKHSYPRLQNMLDWYQKKGLYIGANTHDQSGISTKEQTYQEVCKALGREPGQNIPFDLYNKTYAMAQENIVVRALDSKNGTQGIDFSWIDYQQGETNIFQKTQIPKINPTIVLNYLRSSDPQRHGEDKRGLILARWGGLGNHRYPLGFSGDQNHDWKGLAYLPYFTSTAANVAFNYWSHDTVGGAGDLAADYELSVRWTQTSAWSPVLRFHDKGQGTGSCAAKDECAKVVPWDIPTPFFEAIRQASQVRDTLIPYIYTASFLTTSNGLALCRPSYYEDPTDDALYGLNQQYLFGPDMIVSPISQPSGPEAKGFAQALGAVPWTVFAPKSDTWVDAMNGDFYSGANASSVYGIRDVPGFIRQGAVIPMRPSLGEPLVARAVKSLDTIDFRIHPAPAFYSGGSFSASGFAVDDDGLTTGYQRGEYSTIKCDYVFDKDTFTITVNQTGDFKGKPQRATLLISFAQMPPMNVVDVPKGLSYTTSYDSPSMVSSVKLDNVDLTKAVSLKIAIPAEYPTEILKNLIGAQGRVRRARYAKDALDVYNVNYGDDRCNVTAVALTGLHMSPDFVKGLPQLWDDAMQQVTSVLPKVKDDRRVKFVSAIMGAQQPPVESLMI